MYKSEDTRYHIGFHYIVFGYLRVQNYYVTGKFPKVIPAWPVAGYAICEIPVVCSSYAKIAKPSWPSSGSENNSRLYHILSRNYKGRECIRAGVAGARTRRSLGHLLLLPLILRLLVLCAPAVLRTRALQNAPAPADPNS